MAKEEKVDLMKLPKETRENLVAMGPTIETVKAAIVSLQKLGLNTDDIEKQLAMAEEQRKTLLNEFN